MRSRNKRPAGGSTGSARIEVCLSCGEHVPVHAHIFGASAGARTRAFASKEKGFESMRAAAASNMLTPSEVRRLRRQIMKLDMPMTEEAVGVQFACNQDPEQATEEELSDFMQYLRDSVASAMLQINVPFDPRPPLPVKVLECPNPDPFPHCHVTNKQGDETRLTFLSKRGGYLLVRHLGRKGVFSAEEVSRLRDEIRSSGIPDEFDPSYFELMLIRSLCSDLSEVTEELNGSPAHVMIINLSDLPGF